MPNTLPKGLSLIIEGKKWRIIKLINSYNSSNYYYRARARATCLLAILSPRRPATHAPSPLPPPPVLRIWFQVVNSKSGYSLINLMEMTYLMIGRGRYDVFDY